MIKSRYINQGYAKIPDRYKNVTKDDLDPKLDSILSFVAETKKGAYIFGPCGTGKTYQCWAIMDYFVSRHKNAGMENVITLLDELRKDIKTGEPRYSEDIMAYRGALIIDDIGAEKMTEWVREAFYRIVNSRYEKELPTFFTSNLSLDELSEHVGDRVASRISEMCHVVSLGTEDRRQNL